MTPLSRRHLISHRFAIAVLALAAIAVPAATHAAPAARDEVVRTERRTVTVPAGGVIAIDHASGHVRVRSHSGRELLIEATFRVSARSREAAETFSRGLQLDVRVGGSAVDVGIGKPAWTRRNGDVGFAVDLDVSVPESSPLSITNRFGDTSVTRTRAPLTLTSGNGRIAIVDVVGPLTLKNRFGAIDLRTVDGDVDVQNDNGPITAEGITGAVTVRSRFGNIVLSSIGRLARIDAMNGPVAVRGARGGATVTSNFGPIVLEDVVGPVVVNAQNGEVHAIGVDGPVEITSRFGGVTVRDAAGRLTVRSANGKIDAGLSTRQCQPVSLESSFGPMVVYLAGGGYALDASAHFGRIETAVPVTTTGTLSPKPGQPSRIIGEIGDGRCPLQLVSRNGNVSLKAGPAPAVAEVGSRKSEVGSREVGKSGSKK